MSHRYLSYILAAAVLSWALPSYAQDPSNDGAAFNFGQFFSDACDAVDPAPFNGTYLRVNRGTSLAGRPHWLFPDDVNYGDGSAACNLVALAFGFVPEDCEQDVLRSLIADIIHVHDGHYAGDPCTYELLLPVLSRFGRSDVAYLLTFRDADVLKEYIPVWKREVLCGINPEREGVVMLKPDFSVEDMVSCGDSVSTPHGVLRSSWTKDLMEACWEVSVPEGVNVQVCAPGIRRRDFYPRRGVRRVRGEDGLWSIRPGDRKIHVTLPLREHVVAQSYLYDEAPHPTCHSSSITEAENGDLLAVYTGGKNEAAPDTRVYFSRKPRLSDEWSSPVELTHSSLADTIPYTTYNPVIWQVPVKGGEVFLFYHTKSSNGKTAWLMRSSDGGQTWSDAEMLPDGVDGAERAQPLLIDGRIIAPGDDQRPWHIRPQISISEDMGHTWTTTAPSSAEYGIAHNNRKAGRVGENFDVPAEGMSREQAFEVLASIHPCVVRHRDGALQMFCRTCHSKISTAWSRDGGLTWGHESLTDEPNNNAGISFITLRDGRFVKVCNDFESLPGASRYEHSNARTPLSLFISDDGVRWDKVMDIEDGPIHSRAFPSGYCYPNIIEGSDGYLHLVFTWQRRRIKYVKIKL